MNNNEIFLENNVCLSFQNQRLSPVMMNSMANSSSGFPNIGGSNRPSSPPVLGVPNANNPTGNPQVIYKPNTQEVVYKQNIMVRWLQPPTPPPPAPIIIRGKLDML
jgi:hypothetical protein